MNLSKATALSLILAGRDYTSPTFPIYYWLHPRMIESLTNSLNQDEDGMCYEPFTLTFCVYLLPAAHLDT